MGNSVYLELRGSDLPILVEEDVVTLECNNGLPLFWLALIREKELGRYWEGEVRTCYARVGLDDSEDFTLEPIRLGWREANANLASACALAETHLPELFPLLRAWADTLLLLARKGPAQELRLDVAEATNNHPDADSFLGELRTAVQLWHGPGRPHLPPITDVVSQLTGTSWPGLASSFPETLPTWRPGRPVPGTSDWTETPRRTAGPVAEWIAVILVATTILGMAVLGMTLFGSVGVYVGRALGLVVSIVVTWRWARRDARR